MGLRRIETGRGYERKVRHGAGTVAEGRIFYTSGMTSRDPEGNVVGKGDMAAQVAQAYANIGDALRAAGTDFEHVVKYTIYVTDIDAYRAVSRDRRGAVQRASPVLDAGAGGAARAPGLSGGG